MKKRHLMKMWEMETNNFSALHTFSHNILFLNNDLFLIILLIQTISSHCIIDTTCKV